VALVVPVPHQKTKAGRRFGWPLLSPSMASSGRRCLLYVRVRRPRSTNLSRDQSGLHYDWIVAFRETTQSDGGNEWITEATNIPQNNIDD
jgi:hypothetical protein